MDMSMPSVRAAKVEDTLPLQMTSRDTETSPPQPGFRYNFETEDDHVQEVEGTMKKVGDTEVVVMKGSYSYVGADGLTYEVDWYADETGYHPSAPHLPQPVEPLFPEIVEAVAAQLRFAAEEEAAAAASARSESYAAPPLASYGSR